MSKKKQKSGSSGALPMQPQKPLNSSTSSSGSKNIINSIIKNSGSPDRSNSLNGLKQKEIKKRRRRPKSLPEQIKSSLGVHGKIISSKSDEPGKQRKSSIDAMAINSVSLKPRRKSFDGSLGNNGKWDVKVKGKQNLSIADNLSKPKALKPADDGSGEQDESFHSASESLNDFSTSSETNKISNKRKETSIDVNLPSPKKLKSSQQDTGQKELKSKKRKPVDSNAVAVANIVNKAIPAEFEAQGSVSSNVVLKSRKKRQDKATRKSNTHPLQVSQPDEIQPTESVNVISKGKEKKEIVTEESGEQSGDSMSASSENAKNVTKSSVQARFLSKAPEKLNSPRKPAPNAVRQESVHESRGRRDMSGDSDIRRKKSKKTTSESSSADEELPKKQKKNLGFKSHRSSERLSDNERKEDSTSQISTLITRESNVMNLQNNDTDSSAARARQEESEEELQDESFKENARILPRLVSKKSYELTSIDSYDKGPFTKEERNAVARAIKLYVKSHQIPPSDIPRLVSRETKTVSNPYASKEYANFFPTLFAKARINRALSEVREFVKSQYGSDSDPKTLGDDNLSEAEESDEITLPIVRFGSHTGAYADQSQASVASNIVDTRELSQRYVKKGDRPELFESYNKGAFTLREREAVKRAVSVYLSANQIPEGDVYFLCNRKTKNDADDNPYTVSQFSDFYKTVHEHAGLNRTLSQVHTFVRRVFGRERKLVGSPWTPDEDEKLKEMVKIHGNKWAEIGRIMERIDCKEHFRLLEQKESGNIVFGKWSPEEEHRLAEVIKERYNGQQPYGGQWEEVAKHVKTRNARQCRMKFDTPFKQLYLDLYSKDGSGSAQWTKDEDLALLQRHYLLDFF
ncbi:Cyclin-D-binding Myb-like transcription factor 1 [Dinochytrium kinnereticum]|nr:Cyclin-D-binding Myb-like transcription factor 1 [Dinochytrium kinnereticum]